MSMDTVTEIVSHMIGMFHIQLEEERMRDVYEKFKMLKAAGREGEPIEAVEITFRAPYQLKDYTPALEYADLPPVSEGLDPFGLTFLGPVYALGVPVSIGSGTPFF
ncbi:hypothetical protein K1T73_01930 [Roseovarius sp. SCSIO 43702]|uniref:hypothetical protein n=1 Tax=Roseovarius sp. SCSIO 43702 TaxID=2823043 RepID=UPI001C733792|nr:hypothetical protein [Roseovarius sp. SCSIO 43702]QYX57196.1 hypothetical protein K1T73_01930 [Roseovarius sp. SCSIO 43702]